jgi:transcriptional regulator with XRE-family HTH domain
MTQAEFGKRLGVTQGMVNQWISNFRPVNIVTALDIEIEFGIPAQELNNGVNEIKEKLLTIERLSKKSKQSR